MAEESKEMSHEELRDSTYDVMSNALQELREEDADTEPTVEAAEEVAVSYTHLTLPTICSV